MATSSHGMPQLSSGDLFEVLEAVYFISKEKIFNFGLSLELEPKIINALQLRNDEKEFLREILKERLKREPPLTWGDIVKALRSLSVGEDHLAREIEFQYVIHPQLPSSAPQQQHADISAAHTKTYSKPSLSPTSHSHYNPPHATSCPTHTGKGETRPHAKRGRMLGVLLEPQSDPIQDKTTPVMPHLIFDPMSSGQTSVSKQQRPPLMSSMPPLQLSALSQSHGTYYPTLTHESFTHQTSTVENVPNEHASCWDVKYSLPHSSVVPQADYSNQPSSCMLSSAPSSTPPDSVQTEPAVKSFIDYVKAIYRSSEVERNTSVVKWPPTPSKVYINLVCIDRHSVSGRSRKYEEVTKAMVCDGNVDAIMKTKGVVHFSEIASTRATYDSEGLILVEGAPGVGKSTFAREFCRRWERGEIAQQYQLVLLLRLREQRVSNAKTLEDLIYHPSKDVCQSVRTELESTLGAITLIILEGFDELPDICRKGESVIINLIAGKLLPLATILVTSRPWATERICLHFGYRVYQHIEILGFTDRQITEYIESTLPQHKVSDLEAYLESHPQIRAGMYIPLHSAILVRVYEESQASGCAMPTTLTETHTSLTLILLLRYLCGHPEYKTTRGLITFHDLPQPVYSRFCELCALAYNGMVGSGDQVKLIFRGLPPDFDDLGFMDSVSELYVTRGAVTSYNFLNYTFQEFFAAVHISSMSPAEQMEHFKRDKDSRLKVVLQFLAGLNKLSCFSTEEIEALFFHPCSERSICGYNMSCDAAVCIDLVQWLFETQSDDVIAHTLGQKTIEFELSSTMLPLDYYSLGYCISHSQCQWVLELKTVLSEHEVKMLSDGAGTARKGKVVGLRGVWREYVKQGTNAEVPISMSGEHLNMIFTEWRSILHLHQLSINLPVQCKLITWPELSALRVLELTINGKTDWNLNTLLPQLSLESLTIAPADNGAGLLLEDCVAIGNHVACTTGLKELCISLTEGCIMHIFDEKGVEAITAALASNQSQSLKRLVLECECTFTSTAGDSLTQFIANTTALQYLSIMYCTLSAHALLALARPHNSNLQLKNLKHLNLKVNGDNEAKELLQLLVKNPDMMSGVHYEIVTGISDEGAVALARALLENSTLRGLHISNSNVGAEALAQALHHNSTLLELTLSCNSISDGGVVALACALHHNSTLLELKLSSSGISDGGAVALAQALHHNSTLKKLYLSNNCISDAGTVGLAQALQHNNILLLLDMSNNSISDAGAVALAQALHHNAALQWLYLSNNSISDAGAVALAQALHHNATLQWLYLSNSSISDAGAVALSQALHYNSTLTCLGLYGNDGIGEEGTHQLVQALTSINEGCSLSLPTKCEEYAKQSPQFNAVEHRIMFS